MPDRPAQERPRFSELGRIFILRAVDEVRASLVAQGFVADVAAEFYKGFALVRSDLHGEAISSEVRITPLDERRIFVGGRETNVAVEDIARALETAAHGLTLNAAGVAIFS